MRPTHVSQVDESATITTELHGESATITTMSNGWQVVVNDQGVFVDGDEGEVHAFRWDDHRQEEE